MVLVHACSFILLPSICIICIWLVRANLNLWLWCELVWCEDFCLLRKWDKGTKAGCDWIQDFLTGRPQVVKVDQFTSNSITLNVGAPQGCVLSPLLYSLYTHDCVSYHSSTSTVKFADDTVVLGLINNDDETAYLHEVERLTSWCQDNCLSLNVSKTKELIVDFRKRQQRPYYSSYDQWDPCGEGEQLQVPRCKHLRGPDMDYTHSNSGTRKPGKGLYHLRQLRTVRVSPAILKTFYSGAIESVLTQCISVWYGNSLNQDCKALQRVVRLAEHISGSTLPSLQDIYLKRCKSRAAKIIKDSTHPGNHLFCLLPSGKRFQEHDGKNWETEEELLPSGHQAPKHKPSLITSTWLHLINSKIFTILHHPYCCYMYIPCTTCLHIPAYIIIY